MMASAVFAPRLEGLESSCRTGQSCGQRGMLSVGRLSELLRVFCCRHGKLLESPQEVSMLLGFGP